MLRNLVEVYALNTHIAMHIKINVHAMHVYTAELCISYNVICHQYVSMHSRQT